MTAKDLVHKAAQHNAMAAAKAIDVIIPAARLISAARLIPAA